MLMNFKDKTFNLKGSGKVLGFVFSYNVVFH